MLLEYGLSNFLSFKEGVTVSFRLDANCPNGISQGRNFATVMCVKGANGSGKTHLLKGLAFISDFTTRSFARDPEDEIKADSFFGNAQPSEFFVEFEIGKSQYRYELSVTPKKVYHEVLYRTVTRRVKLFERNGDSMVHATKALQNLARMKLRSNASTISIAHQYEIKELTAVHQFFKNIFSNVGYDGVKERSFLDLNVASDIFFKNKNYLDFAKEFIRDSDIGIVDITIAETESPEGKKKYHPVFLHSVEGKAAPVLPATESSGTKQLFRNLLAYKVALDVGGVLVLDEFDIYLHPHILPKLVKLFADPETNTRNAQILFTTHNLEIIDISGRYRTYLVNKEDNISYAFRLDEIPGDLLRNDRSIIPAYREGRIGGVPRL